MEGEFQVMTALEERLLEEIEFWKRFISDWNTDRKGPLPRKVHDALVFAELKMNRYLDGLSETADSAEQLKKVSKDH